MKKLVVAMMMMLVVGITQAATCLWSSGAIKDAVTGVNLGNNNGNYSAIVSIYTDALGTLLVPGVTGNTDDVTAALSQLNGTLTPLANGTTYYAKLVITSDDGKWMMQSSIAGFTMPPSPSSGNINFLSGNGFATAGSKMGAWTSVPEPTSMALLALGVAAVGLRRKFRK